MTKHHCDCTSADTTTASFAGRFCQYESTSFCSKSENQNGNLFCVNNGECLGDGVQGKLFDFAISYLTSQYLPSPSSIALLSKKLVLRQVAIVKTRSMGPRASLNIFPRPTQRTKILTLSLIVHQKTTAPPLLPLQTVGLRYL